MSYKEFDKDFCISIPDQLSKNKAHPKPTLLTQGATMVWEYTRWWQKILVLFFLALMLLIPLLTNWMNVQMVQGSIQSFAISFCIIRILERLIDVLRDYFLLRIGTKMQSIKMG